MNEQQAEAKLEYREFRVKHRTKPSEPFAQPNSIGVVWRDPMTGSLRITPKWRYVPAQAYVSWNDGEFFTWERLADLVEVGKPK